MSKVLWGLRLIVLLSKSSRATSEGLVIFFCNFA
jgi:hypothetical protein